MVSESTQHDDDHAFMKVSVYKGQDLSESQILSSKFMLLKLLIQVSEDTSQYFTFYLRAVYHRHVDI